MNVLLFVFQMIWCTVAQLAGIVLGFIVVPIMLMFGRFDPASAVHFTDYNTNRFWTREKFPRLFWAWDNEEDSSMGDKRGWWDFYSFGADASRKLNRFWWLAVRNPFNNFKRKILGVDIREYVIVRLAGQDYVRDDFDSTGWQFLKAEKLFGRALPRYQFYWVKRWGNSDRALVVQLGNKIRLEHNGAIYADEIDYFKGFTFEINPWKNIA